ncbi:nucleotidyltransferase family protein [Streptomyces sp. NPDC093991]|uniref:nucleotidyltransferase family protein n=1 Tax=unclassified Streptomyces TaxID=2593676 RepID=UPI0034393617
MIPARARDRDGTLLEVPGWYLTAGCLFPAVWNAVTGRPPAEDLKDYDVFRLADRGLSWEAEDGVIRAAAEVFADLPAGAEIRNETRVHLRYEQKFGVPCAPCTSTGAAIDSFAATTCCPGVRLDPGGRWRVCAPHELSDVFGLVVRPNPVRAPRAVYEAKTARRRRQWPELTVLEWPTA